MSSSCKPVQCPICKMTAIEDYSRYQDAYAFYCSVCGTHVDTSSDMFTREKKDLFDYTEDADGKYRNISIRFGSAVLRVNDNNFTQYYTYNFTKKDIMHNTFLTLEELKTKLESIHTLKLPEDCEIVYQYYIKNNKVYTTKEYYNNMIQLKKEYDLNKQGGYISYTVPRIFTDNVFLQQGTQYVLVSDTVFASDYHYFNRPKFYKVAKKLVQHNKLHYYEQFLYNITRNYLCMQTKNIFPHGILRPDLLSPKGYKDEYDKYISNLRIQYPLESKNTIRCIINMLWSKLSQEYKEKQEMEQKKNQHSLKEYLNPSYTLDFDENKEIILEEDTTENVDINIEPPVYTPDLLEQVIVKVPPIEKAQEILKQQIEKERAELESKHIQNRLDNPKYIKLRFVFI